MTLNFVCCNDNRFQWDISKLVQSLPELIHHQHEVVVMLTTQMLAVPAQELQSYFNLLSVLAKDLKTDIKKHFHMIVNTLLKVLHGVAYSSTASKGAAAVNPELTGKLFECLSHLLK